LLDLQNVVVKIIRKDYLHHDRDKFIEHFSWVTGVHHRQLAKVFDAGLTSQQHLYFVRECLTPLELSTSDPVTTIKSLIAVLEFLSTHKQVHGNIKPSNIFGKPEDLQLADPRIPGLKQYDAPESIHFVAPEILRGGDISHEADLYSLGAVIYL